MLGWSLGRPVYCILECFEGKCPFRNLSERQMSWSFACLVYWPAHHLSTKLSGVLITKRLGHSLPEATNVSTDAHGRAGLRATRACSCAAVPTFFRVQRKEGNWTLSWLDGKRKDAPNSCCFLAVWAWLIIIPVRNACVKYPPALSLCSSASFMFPGS